MAAAALPPEPSSLGASAQGAKSATPDMTYENVENRNARVGLGGRETRAIANI